MLGRILRSARRALKKAGAFGQNKVVLREKKDLCGIPTSDPKKRLMNSLLAAESVEIYLTHGRSG